MKNRLVAACLALVALTGCNLPGAIPTPSLPPPAIADEYLTGVRFVSYDPFDSLRNWNVRDGASLADGMMVLRGSPRWQSSFWPRQQFKEGQGLIVRFKVHESNAQSELVFVTGEWRTDSFRQFGVYGAVIPKGDLFHGQLNLGGYNLKGSLRLLSDTWYEALLAVGPNGHFLAVVWNPDDEQQRAFHDVAGGPGWAGRSWVFLPKANEGETVTVDDYYRIAFADIK